MKKHLLLFILFISCTGLFSQQNYVHYTVKDGLPQMQCMKLFQDSKGYVWIATKGGISKYNGITFKNFTTNNGLPSNRIFEIKEDQNGNIWAFTHEGVSVLKDNHFEFFSPKQPFTFDGNNSTFIIDKQNVLWFFESKNQELIRFSSGNYTRVFSASKNKFNSIHNLTYNKKKNTIVFKGIDTTNNAYFVFIDATSLQVNKQGTSFGTVNYQQNYLVKNQNNHQKKPLQFLYTLKGTDTIQLLKSEQSYKNIKRLNDSTLVFTSVVNSQKMPLYYLIHNNLQANPNKYSQINDIIQDSEQNIWIASEKGLYKTTPFYNYSEKDNMPDYVWAIQEDNQGKIWFSSYNNQYLFYKEKGIIQQYPQKFKNTHLFLGATQLADKSLVFSRTNGLLRYNGSTFTTENLPENAAPFSFFEDPKTSTFYAGTSKGLFIDNHQTQKLDKAFTREKLSTVLQMARNKKGEIWYVTKKHFGKLKEKSIIKNKLIQGSTSLFFDKNDNIWIGAENGLFFYDYCTIIRVIHPELTTMISAIVATDNNHFVYGGLRGIGILNLDEFYGLYQKNTSANTIDASSIIDFYTQSHGFLGEEIAQNGIFKDRKGSIWVPTNNNVVQFYPKELKKNTKAPYTQITRFQSSANNNTWTILQDDIKNLHYKQRNIRFDFIGISLTAPDMVKYKFRLKGYSNLWRNETKERYVTYNNLPVGEYTFELMASNNNGVWNKKPITKTFTIVPAWWQTVWFRFFSVLLFVYAMYRMIHFFYIKKRKKIELESELNRLQQQSIQSQLYPHLLFNAVSATGSVIYKENKEKAYDFVVKLSKFMRKALKDSQKLYKTIDEEMSFVDSYLQIQKIRFPNRFDYQISIDKNVDTNFKIPQMLIQTYVENAVKHGLEPLKKGGLLQIHIQEIENTVSITIQDNGIGIEKSKQSPLKGTGSGLRIMNEIFELHNQKHNSIISYQLIDLYKKGEKGTISLVKIVKR